MSESLDGVQSAYARLTEGELDNLGIVLGAYRSFRGPRRKILAYASMPITTGVRLRNVCVEHGVTSAEELNAKLGKDALWELVIRPNIQDGIAFADALGRSRDDLLWIAPSVFEAKKWRWSQDAYMSLWYRVIGELAGRHVLMDGWQYSVGGVLEVMFSLFMRWRIIRPSSEKIAAETFGLKNFLPGLSPRERADEYEAMWRMRVYDASERELLLDEILAMVVTAIEDLRDHGLAYGDLVGPAYKIMQTPFMSPCPASGGHPDWPPSAMTDTYDQARERIKELARV